MNLHTYNDERSYIDALSSHLEILIEQLLQTKPQVVLALSGGRSPIPLFEKLNRLDLPWDKICLTLVDERITPLNHPDSNQTLICSHLLKNKALAARFIPINPDKHLDVDIAILGMGEDGHTASIFPDCPELELALYTSSQYIETHPQSAKYTRQSLSLSGITAIPHLIIAIHGETKLKVFNEAARGKNSNYPISYLLHQRLDCQIFWHN